MQKKAALCCSSGRTGVAASALPAATQCSSYCTGCCTVLQQVPPRLTYNHLDYNRNYVNEISHKSDSYDNKKKGEENKNKNKNFFTLFLFLFENFALCGTIENHCVCVCVILIVLVIVTVWFMRNV